jgi:hypothetical protein
MRSSPRTVSDWQVRQWRIDHAQRSSADGGGASDFDIAMRRGGRSLAWNIVTWFRYVVGVSEIVTRVPLPPEGLRPGQLGVVAIGRVIMGDVAATLVDLAVRDQLRIDEDTTAADAGWLLTPAAVSRPRSSDSIVDYEQVLLEGIAGAGKTRSLAALASQLPATLEKTRHAIVQDTVRHGWLHHLHHEERTKQGDELVVRIRAFQHDLRHLKSAEGPQAFTGGYSPTRCISVSPTRPRICWQGSPTPSPPRSLTCPAGSLRTTPDRLSC